MKKLLIYFLSLFLITCYLPLKAKADDFSERPKKSRWKSYFTPRSSYKKQKSSRDDYDSEEESAPEGMVDLIDVPTTNVIDYGGFRINFRFYSKGGVLSHLSFGVFRRLNLGASWDIEKFIGADDPDTNVPTLNIKLRAYDGGQFLPSLAIGYDGQGRFYDRAKDQYKEREKGLFAVLGRELFLPNLEFFAGANISQFKEEKVFGFTGLSYNVEEKFYFMSEYDNLRSAPENRINLGIRIFPLSSLGIDFAVRNLADKENRERVVRINYVGSF